MSGADSRACVTNGKPAEMKPNFALILSFDGIGLLHRVPSGWHLVGEAQLDDSLSQSLGDIRDKALQLETGPMRSKLVLPNDQIKYITLETGPLEDAARAQIARDALEGATPYAVEDLVFDWVADGALTHIAAVARETLAEAEAFANEHAFAPISFVAQPDPDHFLGEPFFGLSQSAEALLGPNQSLTRDMQPIRITGIAQLPDPVFDPAPEPTPEPAPPAPTKAESVPNHERPAQNDAQADTPIRETPPDPVEFQSIRELPLPLPDPKPKAETETAPDAQPAAPDAAGADTNAAPSFSSIRARRDVPDSPTAPALSGAKKSPPTAGPATANTLTPDLPLADPQEPPKATTVSTGAGNFGARAATAAAAASAAAGGVASFFSRRKDAAAGTGATPTSPAPEPRAAQRTTPPPALPPETAADANTAQSERQKMTVFGARKPEKSKKAAVVGGKPRYLGLGLMLALLLFLAGVATWASLFLDDGLAGLFGPSETEYAQIPPEELTDTAAIEMASIETPDAFPDIERTDPYAPDQQITPALLPLLTPEQAQARYAATGIWLRSPLQPETPDIGGLDDLYVASIDPNVAIYDAIALPDSRRLRPDERLGEQTAPAAAGTQFAMDERGLVIATTQGAVTPDGVRVFAGSPPLVPPKTPTRFENNPTDPQSEPEPQIAQIRPKARPGNLIENSERANLGGRTRQELAKIRPRLRPRSAQQAAVAAAIAEAADTPDSTSETTAESVDTGSALAVAQSVKPRTRPRNFTKTVARARQNAQPRAVQTAAVKPVSVKPKIPSTASVARQATVKNALNLRRVNLIGVYGKPSSRRALVRMSDGRYRKVKVGDRIDGGRVAAIGDSELRYVKSGRNVVLKMPRG